MRCTALSLAGLLWGLLSLGSVAVAAAPVAKSSVNGSSPPVMVGREFAYQLEIEIDDSALQKLLFSSSTLEALKDRLPDSMLGLRRRLSSDLERFQVVLRSEGYYRAKISHQILDRDSSFTPKRVVVKVDKGPLYKLSDYQIHLYSEGQLCTPGDVGCPYPPKPALLSLELDGGAQADRIAAAQLLLLDWLKERGYPFPEVKSRKVYLQHKRQRLWAELEVNLGPYARIGDLQISGLKSVEPAYVEAQQDWTTGELYTKQRLNQLRKRLVESGLFSVVRVRPGAYQQEEGEVPLLVDLEESKHRTVGTGLSYATTDGFGWSSFWEHRNFSGLAERLRLSMVLQEKQQSETVALRKPDLNDLKKTLFITGTATQHQADAYDQYGLEASVGYELKRSDQLTLTYATSISYDNIEDNTGPHRAILLGLPSSLAWDSSNDLLDPVKGYRFKLFATPFAGQVDQDLAFLKLEARASHYLPIGSSGSTFASRLRIGSLLGESLLQIPANRRFYAGGGIRGYARDSVGPLDSNNDPTGGLSVVEFSVELRAKVTESIGLVPFYDAGNVYDETFPNGQRPMRRSLGLGFRYYTAIGPIRLDYAEPIDRRDGVDDGYQIYISIGQVF